MFVKIKTYYANSPKRIGLSWLAVHLVVLIVGVFCIHQADLGKIFSIQTFPLALLMIVFFPFAFLFNFDFQVVPHFIAPVIPIFFPLSYYILFIFILRAAKNTRGSSFKIMQFIFALLFLINSISSFYFIFNELLAFPTFGE